MSFAKRFSTKIFGKSQGEGGDKESSTSDAPELVFDEQASPPVTRGGTRGCSVSVNQANGVKLINCTLRLKADNLPVADTIGSSDPYFQLYHNNSLLYTSEVIKNQVNDVVWQPAEIVIPKSAKGDFVLFRLKDHDVVGKDDNLCDVEIKFPFKATTYNLSNDEGTVIYVLDNDGNDSRKSKAIEEVDVDKEREAELKAQLKRDEEEAKAMAAAEAAEAKAAAKAEKEAAAEAERERKAEEKAEAARVAAEEAERVEQERIAAEEAERARIEAEEQAERDRIAAEEAAARNKNILTKCMSCFKAKD